MSFKVGDKVRSFGTMSVCGASANLYINGSFDGEVPEICQSGWLKIRGNDGTVLTHPKQCRKLIKKPRRRFWIQESWLENVGLTSSSDSACVVNRDRQPGFIECIEVRKAKKG